MAVYYVDGAVGNDGNLGTSEGSGNAWATINKAAATVAASDKVWIKASANYTETVDLVTAGGSTTWIVFEGYTTTTGDGGKITIDGSSTRSSGIITSGGLGFAYCRFENFIIQDHTNAGVLSISLDMCIWINCEFNNNGLTDVAGSGVDVDNSHVFISCVADGNQDDGFEIDTGGCFVNCISNNNGQNGWNTTSGGQTLLNCVAYNNAGDGIRLGGNTSNPVVISNCTVDGNNKNSTTGFTQNTNGRQAVVINSIFYDCATGISGGSNDGPSQVGFNNCVFNNTTNYSTAWDQSNDDINVDPEFTDETIQNYTLKTTSPCRNAGSDLSSTGMDIGAHQSIDVTLTSGGSGKASNYFEDQISEYSFRGGYDFNTATVYLALYISNPDEDNSGTEVSGGSYVRQIASFNSPANGIVTNDSLITFPTATSDWGDITHFAIFDAETGGNMLVYSEIYPQNAVNSTDTATVQAGQITITID